MVALVPASKPARAALAISTFFLFVISFSLAPIQDFEIGHVFPPLESPTRVTRCKKRIRPIQRFNDSTIQRFKEDLQSQGYPESGWDYESSLNRRQCDSVVSERFHDSFANTLFEHGREKGTVDFARRGGAPGRESCPSGGFPGLRRIVKIAAAEYKLAIHVDPALPRPSKGNMLVLNLIRIDGGFFECWTAGISREARQGSGYFPEIAQGSEVMRIFRQLFSTAPQEPSRPRGFWFTT